jgi:hypothetical protein
MISFYTSHINSLMLATVQLKQVAAIYNSCSEVVHSLSVFLLILCILELQ